MNDPRFAYHANFQAIVAEDIRFVREKDVSYGASWKASGGRTAWHMLRRKMDRLIELMKKPETPPGFSLRGLRAKAWADDESVMLPAPFVRYLMDSYMAENVFDRINEQPDGQDGSVLAEIRDLRRYLMMVEAEMVERGAVEYKTERKVPRHEPDLRQLEKELSGRVFEPISSGELVGPDRVTVPQDGLREPPAFPAFEVHDPLKGDSYWLAHREYIEPAQRSRLARLAVEKNRAEWENLPAYYRPLYNWWGPSQKFQLDSRYLKYWSNAVQPGTPEDGGHHARAAE
jgi:hypothetical protein